MCYCFGYGAVVARLGKQAQQDALRSSSTCCVKTTMPTAPPPPPPPVLEVA
jgi:hypothetical protein